MNLKSQFLSLSALLALGMATTTAWGDTTVDPTVYNNNGSYSVYMPKPSTKFERVNSSWTISDEVKTFKVYDDGGPSGPFSSTKCSDNQYNCSELLQLIGPEGYFLHLTGSMASNANETEGAGAKAYFRVFNGTTTATGSQRINPDGSVDFMEAWTQNRMLLQFYTVNDWSGANGAGLDLTIEVAMDIGQDGPGSYTFPSSVNHLELHASPTSGSAFEKKTVLTAPSGSFMYLAFNDTLLTGDSVIVLNGGLNSTDTLLKKSKGANEEYGVNNDTVYSSSNVLTVCVKASDNGLDKILRATAYVLTKNTELSTAGIDFYTNETSGYTVAQISDVQTGAVSIPTAVNVDVIEYNREFTAGTPATIVLPFQLPAGAETNGKFYYLKKIVQVTGECRWKATMTWIRAKNADALPEANTPYAVIIPEGTELWFKLNGNRTTIQTGKLAEQPDVNGNWIFKGTYEYKAWETESDGIGLDYAIAKTAGEGYKAGDFVKIGSGVTSAPMRAYISKANSGVTLQPVGNARPLAQSEISSIENLPESIDVEFVDEDEKTTAIGRLNTVTGAIKIDRWFDLKGRSTNHKPTTKGAFFNKKGIAK